ncbi:MAG: 4'-phosphopantetheinyl transferase superfamily protein [Pseudonocardia sp.]|nr:4'-phosphopantetheinyl transferase superfamily protein [Pseudonocardia sp.]
MIERLVPPSIATAEAFADVADSEMFPAEAAIVARAVEKRRREFGTVRHCARQALAALNVTAGPLLPGKHREPLWPDGIVGSMTHCAGYRAAAVARSTDITGIGIDAEPNAPLPDGVLDSVSCARERELLAALPVDDKSPVHWDRLLFCAKESTYKIWFPLTRRWLGFEDASVVLEPDGSFSVRLIDRVLTVAGSTYRTLRGSWLVERELILTVITLSATVS